MLELRAVDVLGDELGAGLLELGLRLRQVDARDDAGIELVLHDLRRAAKAATDGWKSSMRARRCAVEK